MSSPGPTATDLPGAGHDGGQVIFEGPPAALAQTDGSLTGQHLRRRLRAQAATSRA